MFCVLLHALSFHFYHCTPDSNYHFTLWLYVPFWTFPFDNEEGASPSQCGIYWVSFRITYPILPASCVTTLVPLNQSLFYIVCKFLRWSLSFWMAIKAELFHPCCWPPVLSPIVICVVIFTPRYFSFSRSYCKEASMLILAVLPYIADYKPVMKV